MSANDLLVSLGAGCLSLTINRPEKHNPLSAGILAAIRSALEANAENPDLKCVIVTGSGTRYFAAGGDLRSLDAIRGEDEVNAMVEACRGALDAVRRFPLPVIAVLNGDAIGGGAELAVACDMRLMGDGARIGFIQGRINVSSAWGGGPDLFSLIGPSRGLRMTTRCEMVDAATALAWGLVDLTFPDSELEASVQDFVAPILQQKPVVLRSWKAQAIAERGLVSLEKRQRIEQEHLIATWDHDDHWTAVDRILSRPKSKS